jgi:hypothetical protein
MDFAGRPLTAPVRRDAMVLSFLGRREVQPAKTEDDPRQETR